MGRDGETVKGTYNKYLENGFLSFRFY